MAIAVAVAVAVAVTMLSEAGRSLPPASGAAERGQLLPFSPELGQLLPPARVQLLLPVAVAGRRAQPLRAGGSQLLPAERGFQILPAEHGPFGWPGSARLVAWVASSPPP